MVSDAGSALGYKMRVTGRLEIAASSVKNGDTDDGYTRRFPESNSGVVPVMKISVLEVRSR